MPRCRINFLLLAEQKEEVDLSITDVDPYVIAHPCCVRQYPQKQCGTVATSILAGFRVRQPVRRGCGAAAASAASGPGGPVGGAGGAELPPGPGVVPSCYTPFVASPTHRSRIEGGIFGLLVGDALGVPYEFHRPTAIPPIDQIEMEPPPGFDRAHAGTPPGTWSDDGAHALCLLASLLHVGRLDPEDLARRLTNWYEHRYLAVDNRVFDVGVQTGRALRAFRAGAAAVDAGPHTEGENGNGSLMRVLPLALWHRGTDAELVGDAQLQSRVTHGHPRSQLCCALYCLWARRILGGSEVGAAWTDATSTLREIMRGDDGADAELEFHIRPDDEPVGQGSGYVVDCLRSARAAVAAGPYEQVVRAAIRLGNDTDTTACVAGGIAGVRDGVEAIPRRWMEMLRERETAGGLIEGLLA